MAEEQQMATYEVWKFSKQNMFYQSFLVDVDANVVSRVLCLLDTPERIDNAVAELLNLSKHPFGRRIVVEADGVGLIVDVVNVATKVEAWHNAVAVLFYLSSSVYCDKTSRVPEAVPTLVHLA
jgi:hypothetical protein